MPYFRSYPSVLSQPFGDRVSLSSGLSVNFFYYYSFEYNLFKHFLFILNDVQFQQMSLRMNLIRINVLLKAEESSFSLVIKYSQLVFLEYCLSQVLIMSASGILILYIYIYIYIYCAYLSLLCLKFLFSIFIKTSSILSNFIELSSNSWLSEAVLKYYTMYTIQWTHPLSCIFKWLYFSCLYIVSFPNFPI